MQAQQSTATAFTPRYEELETSVLESDQELSGLSETDSEHPFDEREEMELAAELLEVGDEAELEQFLGDLIRGAGRAVGRVVRSPLGRALGGILKGVARSALPGAGITPGTIAVPGVGKALGGVRGLVSGSPLGLELEGLSQEDREYEVARRFVRFAGAAAQRALRTRSNEPPSRTARAAVVAAARRHAPGLLRRRRGRFLAGEPVHQCSCGRLIRHGRKVVVINF